VSYVDAGYAIGLTTLAVYAVSLMLRRRRLERAVERLGAPAEGTDRLAAGRDEGAAG
jgi:hypothetical protein